jgi:TorA maturation chaperone TorD
MFGPLVDQLTALYEEAGLTLGDMPADYLGTQLEFAAHLSESTDPRAASWQARLWHEHLQHWLPRFIEDLCQHSRLLIYRLWGGQLNLLRTRLQARLAYG